MSLFIGTLAYEEEAVLNQIRLGVLVVSLMSGAAGAIVLMAVRQRRDAKLAEPSLRS
jgi:NhaA family Na+:H+ antiporter